MLQEKSLDLFLESYLGEEVEREECFRQILTREQDIQERSRQERITRARSRKLGRRTWFTLAALVILIPLTILFANHFMSGRKYYFISLMIILYSLAPFLTVFEGRKPQARELIIIAVLSAITVAGRAAFFLTPNFKPMAALVILSGVCFGGEAGFLVGSTSALISNFFFGQGPWTPWQMFALGLVGFLAGILYKKRILTGKKKGLCIYGFLSVFFLYGFLMNTSSVLMYTQRLKWETALSVYMIAIPTDVIHAFSTVVFLWLMADPMIDKLERIKSKYGLIGNE